MDYQVGGCVRTYEHPSAWSAGTAVPRISFTDLVSAHAANAERVGELAGLMDRHLREGSGALIVDLSAVAPASDEEHELLACSVFGALGNIVHQKLAGTPCYPVRDRNEPFSRGVRRSITRQAQEFHTDGGWLRFAPEIIGLYCVRASATGGENQLASLVQAHNRMVEEAPDLLHELYQPVPWDRQNEHEVGQRPWSSQPVFSWANGELQCRFYADYVRSGHELANLTMPDRLAEALSVLSDILEASDQHHDVQLKPGEFLLVHNRRIAHARSAFSFEPALPKRRLLYRLWTRPEGTVSLEGR